MVPVEDMTAPEEYDEEAGDPARSQSIWPHVEERVADLIADHTSTIVFANSRRLAERLTARLNEIAADRAGVTLDDDGTAPAEIMAQSGRSHGASPVIAKAHHGSVSKEQRALIEDDLKTGRLPCVVATSSLELGIDMGAVDLVIQIESPPSVASALQRVGRAGHQVGETSRGVLFPKHRGDLAQTAVAVERMQRGAIESLRVPANPLDVLAQQVVAATALDAWDVDELYALVTRAAPFTRLPRSAYDATLDLLSGRYPSDEFAELRPRIVWDRVGGTLTGRPGAQRLSVTSGGTIPDRGLFGVFLVGADGPGRRVGELDEEMVYESRVGDVFALGATSWRIEDITHDRVLVSPAPGVPGRLPFWKGDTLGRPAELGEAIGAFTRELAGLPTAEATERARGNGLDPYAAANLVSYVTEQVEATNVLPSDRTLLVERFRDELGDWRLVVHSPYGTPVHAPWALAINARLRERYGVDGQAVASDDGIVIRIPETDAEPPSGDVVVFEPDEIDDLVTSEVGGSALFASRFRECAARALLLPRRDPGRRSPLWQQRQRSAALLEVAAKYPSFPIVLEAVRECLQDVYDLPHLVALMRRIERREVQVVDVATHQPSPYARSLLFGYVAQFVYEGDSPIAERRAAALSLDQGLLAELLGRAELRELLDPEVLAEVEAELQRLAEDRRARSAESVADLLRLLGPLSADEVAARCTTGLDVDDVLAGLALARRAVEVRVAGEERWAAIEDIGRLRDGLGVPVPPGTPDAFTEPVEDPLADLVGRFARTHGPFTTDDVAARLGLGAAVVRHTLQRLAAQGRVLDGEFRPAGTGSEWCDADVLRRLRRRSLARLRHEVEPVEPEALGRFLTAWQHVTTTRGGLRGVDGVLTAIDQLAGCPLPASALESLVLPARVRDYEPAFLDELTSSGEVLWAGHGTLPGSDGWISLHLADQAALTLPEPAPVEASDLEDAVLEALRPGGAWFFRQLADAVRVATGSTDRRGPGARGGAVEPRLGGPGRQRHPRPGPRADPFRHLRPPVPAATAPDPHDRWRSRPDAGPHRPARDGRALGAAARGRRRPDAAGACRRRRAAGAARRGDPRSRGQRAGAGRVRRRLQGPLRVRGVRALPTRLLRGGPGRRPVRHRRRHRPAAYLRGQLDGLARRERRRQAGGGGAGRHRPGEPLRCRPAVAALDGLGHRHALRPPRGPQGGRARGARRRPAHGVRRTRRAHPPHLDRGARPAPSCRRVARRGGPPGLAGPDDRRARRRRTAARLGLDTAPRSPAGRRLHRHPTRTAAPCLRATRSGVPPGCSTGRWPARCSPRPTSASRSSPPSTSSAGPSGRPSPAASTCSPGSTPTPRCRPTRRRVSPSTPPGPCTPT